MEDVQQTTELLSKYFNKISSGSCVRLSLDLTALTVELVPL